MARCRLCNRRAALLAALYFAALVLVSAASTPRRVGDGGEYFAMAMQFASGRPPSLSAEELQHVRQEFAALGAGFESSLLEYPDLVGRDGRQDFLHFFLYPLVVAPAMPLTTALGLHPNWAFTLVNALLLAAAGLIVLRHAPIVAWVAGFIGPIVWWTDKAHTEAFLFATLSVAAVVFRDRPTLALIAFALAGAQNAALAAAFPVFAVLLWLATRRTTFTHRTWMAVIAGAALVAWPFVYAWVRLGRPSPMAEYAQHVVPSFGSVAAFAVEPNIGLLPHAPVYGVAVAGALAMVLTGARRNALPTLWWWPAVIQILLLIAWTQNPNANHGGTPGVNRWTLSLLALSLPWVALARQALPPGGRAALTGIVALAAVMSAAAHLPSRPERYLAPTALAERLWSTGWMHVTPAEVFAERTQGREPAVAPAHDGTCHVLLVADQQAPVQCAPPLQPLPAWCRGSGAMCYAIGQGQEARYIPAPTNGFFYRVAQPSWPAGGPLAAAMHRVLRDADPEARVWRVDNARPWRERFVGADIGVVLSAPSATVVHLLRTTEDARRTMENAGLTVVPLLGGARAENLAVVIRR